jgi:hypothetical protein
MSNTRLLEVVLSEPQDQDSYTTKLVIDLFQHESWKSVSLYERHASPTDSRGDWEGECITIRAEHLDAVIEALQKAKKLL